ALARDRGRELRMVDDSDPGPCQRDRDRLAANIRMPVDRERYFDRPQELLRYVAKRRVGIHEHRTQCWTRCHTGMERGDRSGCRGHAGSVMNRLCRACADGNWLMLSVSHEPRVLWCAIEPIVPVVDEPERCSGQLIG